jgi:hypothetical protein
LNSFEFIISVDYFIAIKKLTLDFTLNFFIVIVSKFIIIVEAVIIIKFIAATEAVTPASTLYIADIANINNTTFIIIEYEVDYIALVLFNKTSDYKIAATTDLDLPFSITKKPKILFIIIKATFHVTITIIIKYTVISAPH